MTAATPPAVLSPKLLAVGLIMGESPRWHAGRLWFCDWGAGEILSVTEHGEVEVMNRGLSMPFSIDWDAENRLLVLSGPERRLLREQSDGSLALVADLRGLCDKPWNELVVDGRGNAYANTIGYDMMAGEPTSRGLIAVIGPDGPPRTVADELAFPNGMAVTPDNSTLIVSESHAGVLTAFNIEADGSLSNRRVWAELPGSAPDGLCLDSEGAAWYADVPNRQCIRVKEGGQVLARVPVDRGCFACILGGPAGRTLYIVAADWRGPASIGAGPRAGQVLTANAPARFAGWP